MKRPALFVALAMGLLALLTGCLTTPVERSGGPGSLTVPNSNAASIRTAAQTVFARYGYTQVGGGSPQALSFQRPAGRFGELMFGSHGQQTHFRVDLGILPIPGTNDFRLTTQVNRVNSANRPGFERETQMMRSWSAQFNSILRDIRSKAADAGPAR